MLRSDCELMYPLNGEVKLWPLRLKNKSIFAFQPGWCSESIHNSPVTVTQSNKMPFQSLSSFIVIPIRHLHKCIIHACSPLFRWRDIKYVCICVCPDVYADGSEAACFVCGLPISDSAEHPPSMSQIYIYCANNKLKLAPDVNTPVHVVLPHDYVSVLLNRMTHLT